LHLAGGNEPQQAALPAPSPPPDSNAAPVIEATPVKEEPAPAAAVSLEKPAKKPMRSKSGSFNRVEPLTKSEELDDSIPW
jgi:hypothetical protein